jgi:GTP-binding protein
MTTGVLNRVIEEAVNRVQPPMVRNKRFKIYYATQIKTRPQRISLFVNNPKSLTPPYEAYLKNQLRKAYNLEGAPLQFILKAKPVRGEKTRGELPSGKPRSS